MLQARQQQKQQQQQQQQQHDHHQRQQQQGLQHTRQRCCRRHGAWRVVPAAVRESMYVLHQRHHNRQQHDDQWQEQHQQLQHGPPHWAAAPPPPPPPHGRARGALLTALASGRGGGDDVGVSGSSLSSTTSTAAAARAAVPSVASAAGAPPQEEDAAMIHIVGDSLRDRAALCDGDLPDAEMCLVDAAEGAPPREMPVWEEAATRGRWLLGLLVLQSTSSMVLDAYQDLLRDHIVVTLFLTMLVGAGGNAGNQSAIKVIRGLATGAITTSWPSIRATMAEQLEVALLLGAGLSGAGFLRVYLTNGSLLNAAAISLSLVAIVVASVVLGAGLPFALARAGVDPAHAGTSIQVLMDCLGVAITCATCQAVLVEFAHGLT